MGEGGPKVQTSLVTSLSKFWGCDVQHGDYSYIVCLKIAKKVDLNSSHCKKKNGTMCGDEC